MKYKVKFYYGKSYDVEFMDRAELDAMISFIRSSNAKYYLFKNNLYNICNYYKIEWCEDEPRDSYTKQY